MSSSLIKFSFWTNNPLLGAFLTDKKISKQIQYTSNQQRSSYHLVFVDLRSDLSEVSQKIIAFYQYCRENNQKLSVILIHDQKFDSEKNKYFRDLLSDLARDKSLHRLVIIPCLFIAEGDSDVTWFNRFLASVYEDREINVSTKGDQSVNPLLYSDFESAMQKIFFLSHTEGKVFWLSGEPINDLSLAYMLQKYFQEHNQFDLNIDTSANNLSHPEHQTLYLQAQAQLNWKPTEDVESKIKRFFQNISTQQRVIDQKENIRWPNNIFHKTISRFKQHRQKVTELDARRLFKKLIGEAFAFLVLIYFGISLVYVFCLYLSLKNLEKAFFYFRKGDMVRTSQVLDVSQNCLRISESNYEFIAPLVGLVFTRQNQMSQNLVSFISYSQKSIQTLMQTYGLSEKMYYSLGYQQNTLDYEEISLALKSNLQFSLENLSQVEIILHKGGLPQVLESVIKKNLEYRQIKQVQDQLSQLIKFIDLIPPTFSGDIGKNIVIVFQNSHEERSTGGVIENILHLTLDRGRFVSQKLYSGSDIDALSKESISPPPLVRDVTGLNIWKVRDLNYNPDFPQTAVNLSWLIEKNLKFTPDIIVFVTDSVLTDLLELEKGIVSPEITATTFQSSLSQGEALRVFPQTITYFTNKLLNHQIKFLDLGRLVAKAMGGSEILFWTADSQVEKNILNQNYAGSIRNYECHPGMQAARVCLAQTSHLSISNFSALPLNSYLIHSLKHQVYLETNKIRHRYLIDYEYTKNTPLLNRNLIEIYQLYLPQGSLLKSITVDTQPLGLSGLLAQSEVGLDRYQFPISTTLNANHQVIIDYDFPLSETVKLPIALSITEIRQFGSHADGVSLEINHPVSVRPSAITSEVTTQMGKILYRFPQKTSTFGVHFVPNQI